MKALVIIGMLVLAQAALAVLVGAALRRRQPHHGEQATGGQRATEDPPKSAA
jgi:CBS-domain-containing membrane protein